MTKEHMQMLTLTISQETVLDAFLLVVVTEGLFRRMKGIGSLFILTFREDLFVGVEHSYLVFY
jgi:hypothetical protein